MEPDCTISLDYGHRAGASTRRIIRRILWVLLAVGLSIVGVFVTFSQLYHSERRLLRATLESVPGIRVIRIDGYPDGLSWKLVSVTIAKEGSATLLSLRAPTKNELLTGQHFRVERFGPYVLGARAPEGYWPDFMDFGSDGPFSTMLPFQSSGLEDFVARYDEMLETIAALPSDGTHKDKQGREFNYQIRMAK